MINRRYSSISPVLPIQSWEAGLFPSLSADLVTFAKLLDVCASTFIHLCVHAECVHPLFVPSAAYANLISLFLCCSELSGQFVVNPAVPQPSTEGQCSSLQLLQIRSGEMR